MPNKRLIFAAAVAALLGYCFLFQGARGLCERDEGRYTAIAVQMIKTGDWIHPRINYRQELFSKPPLTYWLIASSVLTFGKTEWAARLPSAASFFGSILAVFLLGRLFVPRRPWVPALVYGMFFFTVTASNIITTDGLLTFFEVSAVTSFAYAFWGKEKKRALCLALMWFFFALAFLTKGPPGLLPLLAIVFFAAQAKKRGRAFSLKWFPGLLIFLILGGSWYFYVMFERAGLAHYFFSHEIYDRVFSTKHHRNGAWYSFLYSYVPILLFGPLPWAWHVWAGIVKTFRRARAGVGAMFEEDEGRGFFLLLWVFVPLAVFMIARSRLPLYMLPLFAPLALFAGQKLEARQFSFFKASGRVTFWCAVMLLVRLAGGAIPLRADAGWMAREIQKSVHAPFDQVVFLDKKPVLGLTFYLGTDVEAVTPAGQALEEALQEPKRQLWIIKLNQREMFMKRSAEAGHPMHPVGTLHWDKLYGLFMAAKEKPTAALALNFPPPEHRIVLK